MLGSDQKVGPLPRCDVTLVILECGRIVNTPSTFNYFRPPSKAFVLILTLVETAIGDRNRIQIGLTEGTGLYG